MNIKKIKELIDLMNENNLTEIEVEQEGMKVKLIKMPHGTIEQITSSLLNGAPPSMPVEPAPAVSDVPVQKTQEKKYKEIRSPMVGTFYSSPSPDAEPYVKEGSVIKNGDVVCIVEAMKLMNEVKSEISGKIVEVCIKNAEAVEFNQVLFLVDSELE